MVQLCIRLLEPINILSVTPLYTLLELNHLLFSMNLDFKQNDLLQIGTLGIEILHKQIIFINLWLLLGLLRHDN